MAEIHVGGCRTEVEERGDACLIAPDDGIPGDGGGGEIGRDGEVVGRCGVGHATLWSCRIAVDRHGMGYGEGYTAGGCGLAVDRGACSVIRGCLSPADRNKGHGFLCGGHDGVEDEY